MEKDGNLEDINLMKKVACGDKDALGTLYDRYAKLVYSLALRITGDTDKAEEVTQEVYLTLWKQASTFQPERSRLSTWLTTITHNRAVDELRRKENRIPKTRLDSLDSNGHNHVNSAATLGDDVEEQVWATVRQSWVREAISKLPQPQQEVIVMAYFNGMSQSDIAKHLSIPIGTVKTRVRLAMHKLKESLSENGVGGDE
ncbi:MAG: polymerase, sigma-24 subunit, subfamily [Dehalococcoidia bacterium]|nr:polymerase, sigma-24 subunit, subfamily [Dehalococcoidia bacterium]